MSRATEAALTGSFQVVMNNLVKLEELLDDSLRVYMWRPRQPDLPCIWNWLPSATFEQKDLGRHRDILALHTYISIRHSDAQEEMDKLMGYVDSFRELIDQELFGPRPLGGQRAMRTGFGLEEFRFNDVPTLSARFQIQIQIDRMIFAS